MVQYRQRALAEIKKDNPWNALNPLFNKYISYIEDVCSKSGVRMTDFTYYVKRDEEFELVFTQKLTLPNSQPIHRLETLTGNVGVGKTTFLDYIRKELIHKNYPEIITLYLDFTALPDDDVENLIKDRIIKTLEFKLIKLVYGNKRALQKAYLHYLGDEELNPVDIPFLYQNSLEIYEFFQFVDNAVKTKYPISKIILFTDNIDENKKETIKKFRWFIKGLNSCFRENLFSISTSILIPVRDYNKSFFNQDYFKTNLINSTPLPYVSVSLVVQNKLNEITELIKNSTNHYTQYVDFTKNYHYQGGKSITITKDSIVQFLQSICGYILNKNNPQIISLLKDLSADNLKILSSNILNFLQSKMLPVTDLFEYHFSPDKRFTNKPEIDEKFVLRCLMAVRFPYYDVEASHVMNVFNLNNSHQRHEFSNVFGIPRILMFLYNHRNLPITFDHLTKKFKLVYYHSDQIKLAIKKCFGYGLLETKYGTTLTHLNYSEDELKLSSSGVKYITDLIGQVSYLQYVCEDTPVSPRFVINVKDKYLFPFSNESSLKKKRLESVMNFVSFLKKQEEFELKHIKEKTKVPVDDYLKYYSIRNNGTGIKISDFIEDKVNNEIKKLSTTHGHKTLRR